METRTLLKYLQSVVHTALHVTEPVVLTAMVVAFWHHSPPIRDNWVWLSGFAPPIFAARWFIYRRLWTDTPLTPLLLIFIALTAWNFNAAPYHRADYLVLVCRPLLGIWLYVYCVEFVGMFRQLTGLLAVSIVAGIIVGFLSLTATQWNEKSAALQFIIVSLPRVDYKTFLPDMLLSFNPNEIAGAAAWLCPLLAGLLLYPGYTWAAKVIRFGAGIAFILLSTGLFLGQSRFAIAGVLLALAGLIGLCVRQRAVRCALLAVTGGVMLIQAALVMNILPLNPTGGDETATAISGRDRSSLENRSEIWASAIHMLGDYPLTGVGMSMFRTAVRNAPYTIPYYAERNDAPPHAHNEWLQMGADMGLPGLAVFIGWQVVTGGMLWHAWRGGREDIRRFSVAIGGGLLAHAVFGLGDAITLWDRYQFLGWWLTGLAGAVFVFHRANR